MEKLQTFGNAPQARFGHTMSLVSKSKVVLFGGATGDTGKYAITGDAYSFDLLARFWRKIDGTFSLTISPLNFPGGGTSPSPRAAHGAAAVDANQLVVYGGATGGKSTK